MSELPDSRATRLNEIVTVTHVNSFEHAAAETMEPEGAMATAACITTPKQVEDKTEEEVLADLGTMLGQLQGILVSSPPQTNVHQLTGNIQLEHSVQGIDDPHNTDHHQQTHIDEFLESPPHPHTLS